MQTAESKKEEFQAYLEKSGVIDALTKVLVGLYEVPERPAAENAIDFIKEYLGAPIGVDIDELRKTCDRQKEEIAVKDKTIAELTAKVEELSRNAASPGGPDAK
ncbi:unnamed protein product (mitochondrion) [Plasmodiophora brassicae]|uniref:c-Myc-binding protein n=2 Tax=Plasmodiophora brassicae TaxID=37360 RepID=A0A3P3YA11_PLABS|nr:unnamed protein product [Plasmodiophora brassicae]